MSINWINLHLIYKVIIIKKWWRWKPLHRNLYLRLDKNYFENNLKRRLS